MKLKLQGQGRAGRALAQRDTVRFGQARSKDEILKFFQAVDSYSSRFATEPGVTFYQHMRGIFLGENRFDRSRR